MKLHAVMIPALVSAWAAASEPVLVEEPVIQYGWQKHERELFDYHPDFVPGWPSFDPANLPVIKELPQENVSLPPLQRLHPDGQWRHWSYAEKLPGKPGYWSNLTLYQVTFDRDGDAYQLVDLTGAPDGAWFLLHNRAGTEAWVPYRLPYGAMPGDYKGRKTDGNLAMMEVADSAQALEHPPVILGTDAKHLLFVAPEKKPDGTLEIPAARQMVSVEGDLAIPFDVPWKAGWGGWGHGEPQRVTTHGPWVFFVWARPVPVEPFAGTPMYIAAWNRETDIISGPVFLGANGIEVDSHNMPIVAVDSKGIIHVVLGAHGTIENPHETCVYLRSLKPLDITAGFTKPERLPLPGTTYPALVIGADDTLHFLVRRYETYAVIRAETFQQGFVLKQRQPPPKADEFVVYPPSQLLYVRKRGDEWMARPLVRTYFGSYVFWGNRLSIDRKGNLYAAYRYSPRSDFLTAPVPGALLTSTDGGDAWHLATTDDFLLGAGLPARWAEPLNMPIQLGEQAGASSLGNVAWGFAPNAVVFDPDGLPWVALWPAASNGIPAFQRMDRDGLWQTLTTESALPADFKTGPWSGMNRHFPVFDAAGRAYALVDGTGRPDGRWTLLFSPDRGATWSAIATPFGPLPGRYKTLQDANANIPRLEGSSKHSDQPPVILGNDNEHLLLVDIRATASGLPDVSRVVRLAKVAGEIQANVRTLSHAGWGGFGHDNGTRAVTIGDNVHVVFARATPVDGSPGTPSYAVTYNRSSGEVSPTVFLGTSGVEIDSHNMPVITADSKGYLHVILGAHGPRMGQHFVYLRSKEPDSTAAWEPPVALQSGTTYPMLLCDSKDHLHVVSRGPNGNLVHDRKPPGAPWEPRRELVKAFHDGRYALFYQHLSMDPAGRIYLAYRAMNRTSGKAGPNTDQRDYPPALLVSEDHGITWKTATTGFFKSVQTK